MSKTDARRMLAFMERISEEKARRVKSKPDRPKTQSTTVRWSPELASGAPAVIDRYVVSGVGIWVFDRTGAIVASGLQNEQVVVDRVEHVSGPALTDGDLPYDLLRRPTDR